jgi:hypothetical protein
LEWEELKECRMEGMSLLAMKIACDEVVPTSVDQDVEVEGTAGYDGRCRMCHEDFVVGVCVALDMMRKVSRKTLIPVTMPSAQFAYHREERTMFHSDGPCGRGGFASASV